jgi:hypothetical protein
MKDRVAKSNIHTFINGTSKLNSVALGYVLEYLDLDIKPK